MENKFIEINKVVINTDQIIEFWFDDDENKLKIWISETKYTPFTVSGEIAMKEYLRLINFVHADRAKPKF